jgi:dihydroxy-acid dehydratase
MVEDGDQISIDAKTKRIDLLVEQTTIDKRKEKWIRPKSDITRGALAKYRATVTSASQGAVTEASSW